MLVKMEFRMTVFKLALAVCSGALILLTGCTYKTVEFEYDFPISRDKAIMIAATNVPFSVIREASLSVSPRDEDWVAYFQFPSNNTIPSISKSELGWSEDAGDALRNFGSLPEDRFRLLTITIDNRTGVVISREASDGVIVGPTGPPRVRDLTSLFLSIGSGICGLVIGALGMRLAMRRHRPTSNHS
jgi:hypothetical protein